MTSNQLWNTRYSSYLSYLHNMITVMYGEGLGYRRIAKRLNEMGVKTARGKEFFPASVHSILKKKKIRDERINKKFDRKVSSVRILMPLFLNDHKFNNGIFLASIRAKFNFLFWINWLFNFRVFELPYSIHFCNYSLSYSLHASF